jgi:hypothetical protein
MKKTAILYSLLLLASFTFAQNIQALKVPDAVKKAFAASHPNIKSPTWEIEKGNYEVGFAVNNNKESLLYSPEGVLLETEIAVPYTTLMQSVKDYIVKYYAGAKVKDAAMITDNKGVVVYEVGVSGKDVLFDAKGIFIKAVKD